MACGKLLIGIAVQADVVVSGMRGVAVCGETMADSGTDSGTAATGTITLDMGSCPLTVEDEWTRTGESYTTRLICFTREGLSKPADTIRGEYIHLFPITSTLTINMRL